MYVIFDMNKLVYGKIYYEIGWKFQFWALVFLQIFLVQL